jgi:ribose transport system permease protein
LKERLKKLKVYVITNNCLGLLLISAVICILMAVFKSHNFIGVQNIGNILKIAALYIVIGLSQMVAMSFGQFTLTLGSIGALAGVSGFILVKDFGMPGGVAILVTLVLAILLGGIQGLIIAKGHLNAFITTLSLQYVYLGLALAIYKSRILSELPLWISDLNTTGLVRIGGQVLFSYTFLISLMLCVIVYIMYKYTVTGRSFLALGNSGKAAQIAGIKPDRLIILGHSLSGLLAGCAAVLSVARFGSISAQTGTDWFWVGPRSPEEK